MRNCISIGAFAGCNNKEDLMFCFTVMRGISSVEYSTKMTQAEYEVVYRVVDRAIKAKEKGDYDERTHRETSKCD